MYIFYDDLVCVRTVCLTRGFKCGRNVFCLLLVRYTTSLFESTSTGGGWEKTPSGKKTSRLGMDGYFLINFYWGTNLTIIIICKIHLKTFTSAIYKRTFSPQFGPFKHPISNQGSAIWALYGLLVVICFNHVVFLSSADYHSTSSKWNRPNISFFWLTWLLLWTVPNYNSCYTRSLFVI